MGNLLQDVRYGLRMLAKNPGFTAVVVLTLALGVGVNMAIFSIVDTLMLRPASARAPEELVSVYIADESGDYGGVGYPEYFYFRGHNQVFSDVVAYALSWTTVPCGGQDRRILALVVSGNYFSTLSVKAARGRTFLPEEDQSPHAHPVAVISRELWRNCFAADPNMFQRTVLLNGHGFTVVGITPQNFRGATLEESAADVWVPIMMQGEVAPGEDLIHLRNSGWLSVLARLKPGVGLGKAGAALSMLARQLEQAYPEKYHHLRVTVVPASALPAPFRGPVRGFTAVLMAVAGLVLLIACANVANLLLARTSVRRREIAVRLAVGATPARLIRQLLTESILLSLLGAVSGVLLALWMAPFLWGLKPPAVPIVIESWFDVRMLGFATALCLASTLLFGLLPALQASKPAPSPELKSRVGGEGYGKARLRNALMVAQLALSLVLLIGAGLCLRSLYNANTMYPGFETRNALAISLDLKMNGYSETQGKAFYRRLLERVEGLAGVHTASLASHLPLGEDHTSVEVLTRAEGQGEAQGIPVDDVVVGPKYFEALGIPILRGRAFSEQDAEQSPAAVIINESLANRWWPGQDPVGKRLRFKGGSTYFEVIGVAKDGKYRTLGEAPRPFLYLPFSQNYQSAASLVVRTDAPPRALLSAVQQEVHTLDKSLVVLEAETLEEHMNLPLWLGRTTGTLLTVFGMLGMAIAIVGIYGVMSYLVAQRTPEIGIRMALGAERSDVLKLVMRRGVTLTLIGIALGLLGASVLSRFLSGLLYGLRPIDPPTYMAVSVLLGSVALFASYIPARRATKVDPMVALRYE